MTTKRFLTWLYVISALRVFVGIGSKQLYDAKHGFDSQSVWCEGIDCCATGVFWQDTMLKHICRCGAKRTRRLKLYACFHRLSEPEEVTDSKRSVSAEVHASLRMKSYCPTCNVWTDKLLDRPFFSVKSGAGIDVMILWWLTSQDDMVARL